jgi:glutamate mutase epsilon subunit
MTIGLIRSETASDLRTLTATGAGSVTRRNLTAVTAGAPDVPHADGLAVISVGQ